MRLDQTENRALLRGVVGEAPQLSHRAHGKTFYRFPLCVPRLSGREDRLNILASSQLLETCPISPGDQVEVNGQVRSFNNRTGQGSRLVITLFAQSLTYTIEDPCNEVHLCGALCKPPVLRCTPLGRDICDMLLAVNRKYRRADYLPCIAWGTLALYCAQLQVGDLVLLRGRLQSRVYTKALEDTVVEHTAFEISVMALDPTDDPV